MTAKEETGVEAEPKAAAKKKSSDRKGKRQKKKRAKKPKSSYYEMKGGSVTRKKKFCPKCGPGVFMAEHKDRAHCGACGYTEMKSKA